MSIIAKIVLFAFLSIGSLKACSLWAVCAKSNTTLQELSASGQEDLESQLASFYQESSSMLHGWSLLCYSDYTQDSITPIYRSNIPATSDSILYWSAVNLLLGIESGRIGLGHLRYATSGVNSIPNPHPWMFYKDNNSFSLIHNGTVDKTLLYNLLTDNDTDISWLESHPPQTFGGGDWRTIGWSNVVDSELILLLIMKAISLENDIFLGFQVAMNSLVSEGVNAGQLNMIFSNGNMIMVFGGSKGLFFKESSEYFSVMTYPPLNSIDLWHGIEHQELIVMDPSGIDRYPNFITTSVKDDSLELVPEIFQMSIPYPNPFNGKVSFFVEGQSMEPIAINIFSIDGRVVDKFYIPKINTEKISVAWSPASTISSGTYLIQASSRFIEHTHKILFIK